VRARDAVLAKTDRKTEYVPQTIFCKWVAVPVQLLETVSAPVAFASTSAGHLAILLLLPLLALN